MTQFTRHPAISRAGKMIVSSFLLISLALMTACDDDTLSGSDEKQVENILKGNEWQVTYFFDGADETYHFSNYIFTFNDNGSVVATKSGSTVNGTWDVISSSSSGLKLVLDFGAVVPFDELSDDWKILERTDLKVRLEDVSGGSGDTDSLTFERV